MKKLAVILSIALVLGYTTSGNADFIDNGGGLIYDKDLNITWYDAPAVTRTWNEAVSWAKSLSIGGVTGWRLPKTLPVNGIAYNYTWSYDGSTDLTYNITSRHSELGYLYSVELGNKGYIAPDGSYGQTGWGLVNTYPFSNLQPDFYWSGTEYQPWPNYAWRFGFYDGSQSANTIDYNFYTLAVHSGDVGGPVPEPATMLLLSLGLAGIVSLQRKMK